MPFYRPKQTLSGNEDLDSVKGLVQLAKLKGLGPEAEEVAAPDKLSFLQRLVSGLGSLNPAEAISRQVEGTENFLLAYPKTILQGIASSLTGTDYGEQTKRRWFGDLLKNLGIENKIARFGIGLVGDILLDPSTYVGGTLMRGAVRGVAFTTGKGLKTIGKVAPDIEEGLLLAGRGAKQALTDLFVYGYGATKGLPDRMLMYMGGKSSILKGLAESNLKRLGTGVFDARQSDEFSGILINGKVGEFKFFDTVDKEMIDAFNKQFPNVKFPLKDIAGAIRRLENLNQAIPIKIKKLQDLRDQLSQPFIQKDIFALKNTVAGLRKELDNLMPKEVVKKVKGKPFMATADQVDVALMNSLSAEKNKYMKMILDLQARISGIESGIIKPVIKQAIKQVAEKGKKVSLDDILKNTLRKIDPDLKMKDEIVKLNNAILKTQNEFFNKSRILDSVLKGKQIAKDRIKRAFATGDFSMLPEEVVIALRPAIKAAGFEKITVEGGKISKIGKISEDPLVEQKIMEQIKRNAQNARKAHIEDPFQAYFPSLSKDKLQKIFYSTRNLKIGSEGYKKEFKNFLKEDELLRDPAEAFFRVESEIAVNSYTRSFMDNIIRDYGMPLNAFKNEQEALRAGYKVLKEKGIFGKEIGYMLEQDWKFIGGQMSANMGALDALAKVTGFDAATSLFKRFVTGPFVPFHIRNWISGIIQNFEELGWKALIPKVLGTAPRITNRLSSGAFFGFGKDLSIARILARHAKTFGEETIKLGKKTYLLDDITHALEKNFGNSTRYHQEYNALITDANAPGMLTDAAVFSKDAIKSWSKKLIDHKKPIYSQMEALVSENNPVFRSARVIGAWIELNQKTGAVLGALEKGLSLDEAIKIARKCGFDYRALTPFESRIMRRIIPFYSFTRFNIELQLRTLGQNPQRINQVIRSIESAQNLWETDLTDEEKKNLPAYLKDSLSIPTGRTKEGVPQFVRTFGTPIEAFTELIRTSAEGKSGIERTFLATLSKVNPYIKVPIELGIGKDSFRQRDIKDVYTAPEYEIAPQIIKDWLRLKKVVKKDYITGLPRTTYTADPERLLVMRSLFTSRGFTYFNNIFNGNTQGFFHILDLVSGIRSVGVDIERQTGFTDRQKKDDLANILRRNGVISEFNKLFIPKK